MAPDWIEYEIENALTSEIWSALRVWIGEGMAGESDIRSRGCGLGVCLRFRTRKRQLSRMRTFKSKMREKSSAPFSSGAMPTGSTMPQPVLSLGPRSESLPKELREHIYSVLGLRTNPHQRVIADNDNKLCVSGSKFTIDYRAHFRTGKADPTAGYYPQTPRQPRNSH